MMVFLLLFTGAKLDIWELVIHGGKVFFMCFDFPKHLALKPLMPKLRGDKPPFNYP